MFYQSSSPALKLPPLVCVKHPHQAVETVQKRHRRRQMFATLTSGTFRGYLSVSTSLPFLISSYLKFCALTPCSFMDNHTNTHTSFSTSAHRSSTSGRGRDSTMKESHGRSRGRGGGGSGQDRIDALGRLLTRILRHMASQLNLNMRSDGYVRVQDLLRLNLKTFANVPISSHTVDDIKEAVRRDNKQRFSLLEENGEILIRANQGHTVTLIETESLLKPIHSAEEYPVCVHGTYKKNLKSILESGLKRMQRLHVHFACGLPTDGEVISGMRRNVNVLIFLDVRKALEGGMKLYISDNKVILTEGFDGVVPVEYIERIESWPDRKLITFDQNFNSVSVDCSTTKDNNGVFE